MTPPEGYSGSSNTIASLACIASTLPESSSFTCRSKPAACSVSRHTPARTLNDVRSCLGEREASAAVQGLKRLSQIWRG